MMKRRIFQGFRSVACGVVLLAAASAQAGDPLIEGGRLCTEQFPIQEKANNIPTHLLAAISTTESGRWHDGLGMAVPWPWTINVEGKGYYFKTKAEAIAQTRNLLAQGHQSIDVGCMQVNLKHHNHAFSNLDQAFDPKTNVAYAAKFLHDNYAELGDWIKATAAYHSRTQVLGAQYLAQIEKSWNKIVSKVAAARASQGNVPVSSVAAATVAATPTTAPVGRTVAEANASLAQARKEMSTPVTRTARTVHPISATHNVQLVNVNNSGQPSGKGSDVLVIRGAPATLDGPAVATPTPVKVANADTPLVVRPAGDSVRRVALDNAPSEAQLKDSAAQPKFVFAN